MDKPSDEQIVESLRELLRGLQLKDSGIFVQLKGHKEVFRSDEAKVTLEVRPKT